MPLTTKDQILSIDEYCRLTDDNEWEDIPSETTKFDNVTIPHEIVKIMSEKEVSAIAA